MPTVKDYPFYLKSTIIIFGLVLLVYICSVLADVLIPLSFAAFIAILLNPLCNRLQRMKISKIWAILISMLIAVVCIAGIIYFLSSQIIQFSQSAPVFQSKMDKLVTDVQGYVFQHFGIAVEKQVQFVKDTLNNSKSLLGKTVGTVLGTLSLIFLVIPYIFMMLFYKTLILNFFYEVFSEENQARVAEILKETKVAIQSYIVGLLVEMVIVATLNSVALMILDVKYAILLGVIGGILNMLPYIGGIIAILLPILMATVTKDGYSTQLGVILAYLLIQFIDNNIIFPRFVSVKVQINALISIVVVLLGNALWGISGMFLSIPFIAVLKIIFDRIDDLKPWGKLLGDSVPTHYKGPGWRTRKKAIE